VLHVRSFAPFWQVMKTFAEKLSNLHQQLMMSWQELMRDVHKYSTEQQRKHREVAYMILRRHCSTSLMQPIATGG